MKAILLEDLDYRKLVEIVSSYKVSVGESGQCRVILDAILDSREISLESPDPPVGNDSEAFIPYVEQTGKAPPEWMG